MKFRLEDGIPLLDVVISYKQHSIQLKDILVDTGCSVTIFDKEIVEEIGLHLDVRNGRLRTMYGIGGKETVYEQKVTDFFIDTYELDNFPIQLGDVKDQHGFDAILGSDFFATNHLIIDFKNSKITK